MSMLKPVTVRLAPEDYEQLAVEARRLGMSPGTLARVYVRAGLVGNGGAEAARMRRIGPEALERLAELTADLPPVDAVEIARDSREGLELRPFLR